MPQLDNLMKEFYSKCRKICNYSEKLYQSWKAKFICTRVKLITKIMKQVAIQKRKKKYRIAIIIQLVALFMITLMVQSLNIGQFMLKMQNKVKGIAQRMVSIYQGRCRNPEILTCSRKSVDICKGTSQRLCSTVLPKPAECANGEGALISPFSGFRVPNDFSTSNLNQAQKMFICSSAFLQQTLTTLLDSNQGDYTSQYFGSASGVIRVSPSFRYNQTSANICEDYDPRLRIWYASGTSSAKNIIILLPISGIVSSSRKLVLIKAAANVILNTLSTYDFFNIILYNENAVTINSSLTNLIRASQQQKQKMSQLIQKLQESSLTGKTNYQAAFQKAFDVFDQSSNDKFGAPCQDAENIILMFTTNSPDNGTAITFSDLVNHINSRNSRYQITLFTYGLSTAYDLTIARKLSCQYKGIFFNIEGNGQTEIATSISQYYSFLAAGVTIVNPTWTAPYTDKFGFGRLVTIAFPAYLTQNGERIILGVAGIDVKIDYIVNNTSLRSQEEIEQQMLQRITCSNTTIFSQNPCIMQKLRPSYSKCADLGFSNFQSCPSVVTTNQCVVSQPHILIDPVETSQTICCSFVNVGLIIGVIVGVVAFLVVIGVTSALYYHKYKKQAKKKRFEQSDHQLRRAQGPEDIIPGDASDNNIPRQGQIMTEQQRQHYIARLQRNRRNVINEI